MSVPEARLEILLLGAPEVREAGQAVRIPRRRTRALLFYLAATRRPHARAHLSTLFWGGSPDREAGRSLSDALYKLRSAFRQTDPLATSGDHVVWNTNRACLIDLHEFEARVGAAGHHTEYPAIVGALEAAAGLWRGPLLAGFDLAGCPAFDDWLALERQRLERRYHETLAALFEHHARFGAHSEAMRTVERLLSSDPLREDAHRWAMHLHAGAGNRAAALRQYALARTVLERELGVTPSPETEALRERILQGEASPQLPVPEPAPASGAPSSGLVVGGPKIRATPAAGTLAADGALFLVGRGRPLEQLRYHVQEAQSGRGKLVLILGEAGIGKSSLVVELLKTVPPAFGVLSAGCQHSSRDMPFHPLIEALRGAGVVTELAGLDLPPLLWEALSHILPELSSVPARRDGQEPPLDPLAVSAPSASPSGPLLLPGWERSRLFEVMTWVLLALARRRPRIIALDDLHWADDATLQYLAYLGHRLGAERLLLVGTYRDAEAGENVAQIVYELARQDLVARIALERLSAAETVALVQHLTGGRRGSERLGQRLHQESAGNPLFIAEMLRSLRAAGFVGRDSEGHLVPPDPATATYPDLPLPESLRELIAGRLARISVPAREGIAAASVLSPDIDDELLQRVTGWSEEQSVTAVEELLRAQVLAEAPNGRYSFTHDTIREVAYRGLSEARRTLLHRRVGDALEARAGTAPGLLAYHFNRGRVWLRAYQESLAAAERAVYSHANREAATHYTTALAAAERLGGEIGPAQWAAVYEARGRVWLGMDDDAAAIADLERALEQARRAGDDRRVRSALRNLALARFWNHEPVERALAHAEAALQGARRCGDHLEIAAGAAVLASILVTRGRLREGIAYAEEAVHVGRGAGDDALVADAVGTLGAAHGWHGSFRRARTELAEALALVQTQPWGMLLVPKMLFFSGINAAAAAEYEAALASLTQCERYARESEDRWWLARLPNTIGWVHQELYDNEAALRYNLEGIEAARRSPWPEPLANALINLGKDYLQQQALDRARRAFDEAAGLLGRDETMQWRWEMRLWLGLGEWWLARGDAGQSLGMVDRALALARQTRTAKNVAKAHHLRGLVLASQGRLAHARTAQRHAARLAETLGSPRLAWESHSALSSLYGRLGQDAAAETHRSRARVLVSAVADSIADGELRVRFLAAGPVRSLLNAGAGQPPVDGA